MKALTGLAADDILQVLMRYCIWKEAIVPQLKKEWRDIVKFIKAQKKFGLEGETLARVVGEYLALEQHPAYPHIQNITNMELRMWINENFTMDQCAELAENYL